MRNFIKDCRFFILIVLLIGVLSVNAFGQLKPGEKAPDFKLNSILEEELSLYDFSGKVVILHFWKAN
ncbi:redoxin domain-containing protein [candidate division KSB1 bacterium]